MGLISHTDNTSMVFLGIANGRITRKTGTDAAPDLYTAVEGLLTAIRRRKVDIHGQPTDYVDFCLKDKGETYQVSTPLAGGIARNIILCLAGVECFVAKRVRFTPYLSRDARHTNVLVDVAGQRVAWVTRQFPPVREVMVGNTMVKDDTERTAFINGLIDQISSRLLHVEATPQALAQCDDDLPVDDCPPDADLAI